MRAEIRQAERFGWWYTVVCLHEPQGMVALSVRHQDQGESMEAAKAMTRKRVKKMGHKLEIIQFLDMTVDTARRLAMFAEMREKQN